MSSQQQKSTYQSGMSLQKSGTNNSGPGNMQESHQKQQQWETSGNKTEFHSKETHEVGNSVEDIERRAHELREQATAALRHNETEFMQANQAQNAARIAVSVPSHFRESQYEYWF